MAVDSQNWHVRETLSKEARSVPRVLGGTVLKLRFVRPAGPGVSFCLEISSLNFLPVIGSLFRPKPTRPWPSWRVSYTAFLLESQS